MSLKVKYKICCILPTMNAGAGFERCIKSLKQQVVHSHLVVVDSSSDDGTDELAKRYANTFISIPRESFNHGKTRQNAVDNNPGYDVYVFLTQDAILSTPSSLENLVLAFDDPEVGCSYGRQLPSRDSTHIAQHARYYNYPEFSEVRGVQDASRLGAKVAFCSNSFAAYRASALHSSGGFPSDVILAEDMYVAAKMLCKGWKVAYCADATCFHSHNYTLSQEFSRYFDIGVFHFREKWIVDRFGSIQGEGVRFALSEIRFLTRKDMVKVPLSIGMSVSKFLGYKLGFAEKILPMIVKRAISMHKGYWG